MAITSYAIDFVGPMRSLNINSIDNNQNIAWDNAAYSLITEARSYGVASNEWQPLVHNAQSLKNTILFCV